MTDSIDERVRAGASERQATLAVVDDFERSAAGINVRTGPLVPASGHVLTGAGLLAEVSDALTALAYVTMLLAVVGLCFLAAAFFTHAGRRSVGLPPTRDDVSFARDRLIFKEASARVGSLRFGLGLLVLVAAILTI